MPRQHQNLPKRSTTRLQNWDYRWDATCFITICTKSREQYFGEITDGKMELSPVGVIADILWHEIKSHAKNVELEAFIVMPNHVHGIIIFSGNESNGQVVGTRHALSLPLPKQSPTPQTIGQERFLNQGKNSLSSIIGS